MFKKIVSQLSFSPALVGQLSFYAKRLRKEQATRRLGLVFVALALVVQSLVVFQGPEPANAANPGDMVRGGLGLGSNLSFNNFLKPYDKNEKHLKDAFNRFGITREEIKATKFTNFVFDGRQIGWGWENRARAKAVDIYNSQYEQVDTLYGRPLTFSKGTKVWGYIGHSKKAGWFAIMQSCGNLVTKDYPPAITPGKVTSSKTAFNKTQNIDASKTTAKGNDTITYTLTAKNTGGKPKNITFSDNLSKVLTFARLTNQGGGSFNSSSKVLSWKAVSVKPGATVKKQFTVKVNSSLVNKTKNCKMTNNFIDTVVTIPVGCTTPPAEIIPSKSARNDTQNLDATKTTAKANDKITYTVTIKNKGGTAASVTPKDDLSDVLTFAKLVDNGGGILNNASKVISWPAVKLAAGASITKKFTVQVQSDLVTSQSDCKLINNFLGESVTVPVGCTPPPAELEVDKTAVNVSQGNVDATSVTAKEKDRITFKLIAKNNGGSPMEFTFEDTIGDTLEYAKVIDNGGASYNEQTRKLTWPTLELKAGETQVRTFSVQILDTIPATPKGISDPSSYDCRIENTFYESSVTIKVNCVNPPKIVEQVVTELPTTGPGENILFAGILLAVVSFFYFRSRQLGTEVRLIRRDINGGTI